MRNFFIALILVLLTGCSPIKYVEDGEYLLNDVSLESADDKVLPSELYDYIQQQPNSPGLLFNKTSLRVYSMSGRDTSKWINRAIRKIGEAPVIYNEASTQRSQKEMEGALQNLGYFNAKVSTEIDTSQKKRISIKYIAESGEPYKVRNYSEKIGNATLDAALSKKSILHKEGISSGDIYDANELDEHIDEVVTFAREQGYYYFSKENLYYTVDSSLNCNMVDIELNFRGNPNALQRMKIGEVETKVSTGKKFLKDKVLKQNTFVRKGRMFSELTHERTYSALSSLGAVSQVDITYSPDTAPNTLNSRITITPSNIHYIQYGIDGTNTAGDFGVETYLTYQNKNIFKGSEGLKIKLQGGYEIVRNGEELGITNHNFFEFSPSISLSFPRMLCPKISDTYIGRTGKTTFQTSYTWQNRPEFRKRYLAFDWKYQWATHHHRHNHTLNLYNITYTRVPWILPAFKTQYLDKAKNALLRQNYTDALITRTSYTFSITKSKNKSTNNFSIMLDMAGTLPYLCTLKNDSTTKKILGVPFSQYARADIDFSRTLNPRPRHSLAWHIGLGMASPYLNSDQIPYERRYFAGGSNSIRGWATRSLGPGKYKGDNESDFFNQTGDIKLLAQAEYRFHASQMIEYAAFLDAGNIWTIKTYENQPGGEFYFNTFYKSIALSYGLGIRFDLSFFLLRFDFAMKAHDPSQEKTWSIANPNFRRDFAWHFGVGYPF